MATSRLQSLIQQGEGYNVAFKKSYNPAIALDICAMATIYICWDR